MHNFTAENGYTVYADSPFFANNSTRVDLNTINFSSHVTIDPSANITLPAKPRISPSASSDVSSVPPSPSQIEAPPQTSTTTTPGAVVDQMQQPEEEELINKCNPYHNRIYDK